VAAVGFEICRPEYVVERNSFSGYGLEFVVQGTGRVILNDNSYPLFPGVLFCYGPRTRHRITCDRSAPLHKYFIDFFGDEATRLLRRPGLSAGTAVMTADPGSCRAALDLLLSCADTPSSRTAAIASALLRVLLLKASAASRPPAQRSTSGSRNFQRCREFIDSHYASLRGLNEAAERLHIQPSYLCRLFQNHAGTSPHRYLISKKMQRAAERLNGTDCAVKEAAAEVGYEDPLHFSRVFKSHLGQSPSDFRRFSRSKGSTQD